MKLARMRTLDECFAEIKAMDENTAVSKCYIRRLALSGKIPVVMCGRKRLINLDGLINEDEIVYDQAVEKQVEEVKAQSKIHCVDDLLHSGATWEI